MFDYADFVEPGTDEYADHIRAGTLPVVPVIAPFRVQVPRRASVGARTTSLDALIALQAGDVVGARDALRLAVGAPAPVPVIAPTHVLVGPDFVEPGTDEYADAVIAPAPVPVIAPAPVPVIAPVVDPVSGLFSKIKPVHIAAAALAFTVWRR